MSIYWDCEGKKDPHNIRTTLKKTREAIANSDANAADYFKDSVKVIDKSVAKNILHKNTAARMKSKLAKSLNASK